MGRSTKVLAVIFILTLLGLACGGSPSPPGGALVDVADCYNPARDESPRLAGALRSADFGTVERQTDVAELVVIGTVIERDLFAEEYVYEDHEGSSGPSASAGFVCTGRYSIDVSRVLKNVRSDPLPSQLTVLLEEREAYPSEGYVIELGTAFSLGDRITWFLVKLGDTDQYSPMGPPQVLTDTQDIAGRYSNEDEQLSVEEFVIRISARAAQVPEAVALYEVLKTPLP